MISKVFNKDVVKEIKSYDKATAQKELEKWRLIVEIEEDRGFCSKEIWDRFCEIDKHLGTLV